MSYARQLLDTYPGTLNADPGMLAATIDALGDCAKACAADAGADLREQDLAEMVKCIRLCLDCTDVCTTTAGILSRQTDYDAEITSRPAQPPARLAAMNANGMPGTMSTAESASRPAGHS